ncbi:MAG TPA: DNA translocase FtsK 4TM domain-containing protein, partial [Gemmatimonadaceae bacterium]
MRGSLSPHLKRELTGIALALLAVFLGGAFGALALAQLSAGVNVKESVGAVGDFLARPLVEFFGWPAAILVPFVPAVHALRLFGRMKSDTDRSWMVFFAGAALLLPVVLGLMVDSHFDGTRSTAAGIWGGFIAHWWRSWFGSFGAWVFAMLAWSVLMAAAL